MYSIEKMINFLTVYEANMALSEQPSHFVSHNIIVHTKQDHRGGQIVQSGRQQPVFFVLEPFAFGFAEALVALHHLVRSLVHSNHVTLLANGV